MEWEEFRFRKSDLWEIQKHTFYHPALDRDSVVLDLGAASRWFADRVFEQKGCRFFLVEAVPENYEPIVETDRIRKFHYAIAGSDGTTRLYVPEDEYAIGTTRAVGSDTAVKSYDVPCISLESFLGKIGVGKIDLAKIDIEGEELAMFDTTSDETLRSIRQIAIEFHDFMYPDHLEPVKNILSRMERLGFFCINFSFRNHGDVLMINRREVGLSYVRLLYFKYGVKYARSLARAASRWLSKFRGS